MGDNAAYSTFQHTIITIYNKGVLDVDLLDELAVPYAETDIDSGGDTGLVANDGLDLESICIRLIAPSFPLEPQVGSGESQEEYQDRKDKQWREIKKQWGW